MDLSFCLSAAEILFIAAITVGVAFLGAANRTDCFTAVCMMVATFRQTAGQSGLPAGIGMFFVCLSADQIRHIARRIVGMVIFGQATGNICHKARALVNMVLRNAAKQCALGIAMPIMGMRICRKGTDQRRNITGIRVLMSRSLGT
jgi:hypothetical protein